MLNFLYPRICPVCQRPVMPKGSLVHALCKSRIKYIESPYCLRCGIPLENSDAEYCGTCRTGHFAWDAGRCLYPYQTCIKSAIIYLKKYGTDEIASFFAKEMVTKHNVFIERTRASCLVPVPMHIKKQRVRGFNQAELLSKEIEKRSGIPVLNLLLKVKKTGDQKKLGREERRENVKGAFSFSYEELDINEDGEYIIPKSVILIDDVCTTGSTLSACAEVLKEHGVSKVYFLCIARE